MQSYSFTLDSTLRDLTLQDFANIDFGVRLTSVGVINGTRSDSSKIMETTSEAINLAHASASAMEDTSTSGNVLDGIHLSGSTTLTGWSGGSLGNAVAIDNGAGATFRLNADGSHVLDASAANSLSAGETITRQFSYTLSDNHGVTDTATISLSVTGVNDGPDALDDTGGAVREDAILTGSVTANDSDVDRLDTHTWSLVEGSFNGLRSLSFNADGTWSYDAKGAYDGQMDGDRIELSFNYLMTDNHGASDMATVRFVVEGVGGTEPPPPPRPPPTDDMFPSMQQAISNVVLYLDDGDASTVLQKVKLSPSGEYFDVDSLLIGDFIATHSGENSVLGNNTQRVGISVRAGQEYPNVNGVDGTRPGEGSFNFLMDGETPPIAAVRHRDAQGGWTLDWSSDDYPLTSAALAAGLSDQLLNAHSQDFAFNGSWLI